MRKRLELKAARVRKGMRQEDLAVLMSVSQQTIAKWEQGRAAPRSIRQIRQLAVALDRPMDALFPDIFSEGVAR